MEQHAVKLFNLYAHFPTALMVLYALTLFLPLSASRILASLIGAAIAWGLWVHFDTNLAWWTAKYINSSLIPTLNAPEGLDYLVREAFIYGFYSCFCVCLGTSLVIVPLAAGSHVRSTLVARARASAKSSATAL